MSRRQIYLPKMRLNIPLRKSLGDVKSGERKREADPVLFSVQTASLVESGKRP